MSGNFGLICRTLGDNKIESLNKKIPSSILLFYVFTM